MSETLNAFGQVISDEDQEVGSLLERIGYGATSQEKKRVLGWLGKAMFKRRDRATLHPFLAVIECILTDPDVTFRPFHRFALTRFVLPTLKKEAAKLGDIPGVNDGLMVRWYWTHDAKYVDELLERLKLPNMIGDTCRWMLGSVSSRDAVLFNQLRERGFFDDPTVAA